MKPVWISEEQFICVYRSGDTAIGDVTTVAESLHDAYHYGEPDMEIVAVWRMINGEPVAGRITSSSVPSEGPVPEEGWSTELINVYVHGPDGRRWGMAAYVIDRRS